MNDFIKRHEGRILGVLSGFDRVLFRGTLRTLSYPEGLLKFLNSKDILLKDFARFAEQCTGQLIAHSRRIADEAGRPYMYLKSPSVRKEDLARQIAERDRIERGLVCVLYAVEPCESFSLRPNGETKRVELVRRRRKCSFFYFYFVDREFGLMHVRLQSWIPFDVQVCLNGRLYLAVQLRREGIRFDQYDNGFTSIGDLPRAQAILNRLASRDWGKTLAVLGRRVNPLLGGLLSGVFDYYWTIRQSECATDVLFKDRRSLQEIYPALCEHAIHNFHSEDVMRFLSGQVPKRLPRDIVSDLNKRPEGVRLRHRVGENAIKMYDKGGCILRIETTINNPCSFRVLRETQSEGSPALA